MRAARSTARAGGTARRTCALKAKLFWTPLRICREALRQHLLVRLKRLQFRTSLGAMRRVLGDARDLGGERVGVAQKLLRLLALDLVALVALDLLLLHLLLVRHHGVRT